MTNSNRSRAFVACVTWLVLASCSVVAQAQSLPKSKQGKLRVFLLAGQSNMEGQAVVDLDHKEHYNGGRGTLQRVMQEAKEPQLYQHLKDQEGRWSKRSDVVVWYRAGGDRLKVGELSVGYAVYDGQHHFGPELQFGHVIGDRFDEPVLLIKTAWGGKSLAHDFRPPSADGETGPYYKRMIAEYHEAIASIGDHFPQWATYIPELTGFVWFQGWNDMCDAEATATYTVNLGHLIRDVRRDLSVSNLPVVVAETGNANHEVFRAAQKAGVTQSQFRGNAVFVPTRRFLREAKESPNTGHGHHWFGNAESYFLIGDAMGKAMSKLLR